MNVRTRLTQLLGIQYPIMQGGMRWAARAELAAAVSNAGGLGTISAHTQPSGPALAEEIGRARALTSRPLAVNLTLLAANSGLDYDGYVAAIVDGGIRVVETAGANPAKYIETFRREGITVVHKCVTVRHALKAQELGADAVSVDGFECAGHPGEDDIPALVLIPAAVARLKIPLFACGGFADGRGLVTALALGAEGINMGTRFLLTRESPLHQRLKERLLQAGERDTVLVGRSFRDSTRVLRNGASAKALEIEKAGQASHAALAPFIGAAQWMRAMAEGETEAAALPVGMVVGLISDIPSCAELIERIMREAQDLVSHRLPQALGCN
jgi:NAD(P)H-dependent flavin oxidoreductase YrpB (nitropropane dioxygenase family)